MKEQIANTYYRKMACSQFNSAAISSDGEVYVWGRGKNGLVAAPDLLSRVIPNHVNLPKNKLEKVVHISMG